MNVTKNLPRTRLQVERERRRLTQCELASGICSPSMISRLEAGKRRPSTTLARRLATRLQLRAAELTAPPRETGA